MVLWTLSGTTRVSQYIPFLYTHKEACYLMFTVFIIDVVKVTLATQLVALLTKHTASHLLMR